MLEDIFGFICLLVLFAALIFFISSIDDNPLENRVQVLEELHFNNICSECGQAK